MYLGYFVANPFPFCGGPSQGPFRSFVGTPRGAARVCVATMGGMGEYYRPNQAVQQYYGRRVTLTGHSRPHLMRLGNYLRWVT